MDVDVRVEACLRARVCGFVVLTLTPPSLRWQDALDIDEFMAQRAGDPAAGRLKVVLLDATWRQAGALNRRWVGGWVLW